MEMTMPVKAPEMTVTEALGQATLPIRVKQVGGIVDKSEYSNRSAMTDQERRKLLVELRAIRCDDGFPIDQGLLNNIDWEIEPLTPAKRRPRKAVAP
jgi:hypothetical protein